jgi:ABC-type sugar transport system permease subunit
MYYPPPKSDSSKIILIIVLVLVIIFIVVPIILSAILFFTVSDMMDEPPNIAPVGALSFTENTPGNYTGGIISLSDRVDIEDVSMTVIDISMSLSGILNPLTSSGSAQVNNGIICTFTDTNQNRDMDAGDVFTIQNGGTGDIIRLVHRPSGRAIAEYTLQ